MKHLMTITTLLLAFNASASTGNFSEPRTFLQTNDVQVKYVPHYFDSVNARGTCEMILGNESKSAMVFSVNADGKGSSRATSRNQSTSYSAMIFDHDEYSGFTRYDSNDDGSIIYHDFDDYTVDSLRKYDLLQIETVSINHDPKVTYDIRLSHDRGYKMVEAWDDCMSYLQQ